MSVGVPVRTVLSRPERAALAWLLGVLALQLVCHVALMFEGLSAFRVVFRTAAFAVSLAALALVPGRSAPHPSQAAALVVLAIVGLGVFHPTTNTVTAGVAQAALYLAVLAPLFWATRLAVTPAVLSRYLPAVWAWYSLSAAAGVFQVYFPGSLQPAVSTQVLGMGALADAYKVTLADGTTVWRPMGLTDAPGGAAGAGVFAVLFGMGYFVISDRAAVRAAGLGSMAVGLFCVYLCQVRSLFVMAGVSAAVFCLGLAAVGAAGRAARVLLVAPLVAAGSFAWAAAVGGDEMARRFETLIEDDPAAVYYRNRGHFLEDTVENLLPKYPAGAGLGRWGTMSGYFGDPTNPDSPPVYVEIQWTGWVLDGGIPLVLAYAAALGLACYALYRCAARGRDRWVVGWAVLVLAYNLSAVAVTFNYPLFVGQGGLEFWTLNAVVFAAASRPGTARA